MADARRVPTVIDSPAARVAARVVVTAAVLLLAWPLTESRPSAGSPEAACLLIDLPSGRRLHVEGERLIRTPVLPGSVVKFVTLVAALDSRVATPSTQFTCRRTLVVDGERLRCSHPALGRPLALSEALAYSCNDAFATLASRLKRADFDRTLLAFGLPPSDPTTPLASAALGLSGVRATPAQWLDAFVRLATGRVPGASEEARRVVLEGLRGAADFGTASALRQRGVSALAKTGTAPMPGGRFMGLVVAVAPAERPVRAIVVVAPGAAGMDAAAMAADRLAASLGSDRGAPGASPGAEDEPGAFGAPTLRVGRLSASGRYEIETLALEDYVARVVAGEAAPGSGAEALRALAVTVRTFALGQRGRHRAEGFDLCDLTHCQVLAAATAGSRGAARATRGLVLRAGGQLASVFYTRSCGGRSERPSRVWPAAVDPPYLVVRDEPVCRGDSRWTSEIRAGELARALRIGGLSGVTIRGLNVVSRTESGRAARIAIQGFEPAEVDAEAFRLMVGRVLGWQLIKSTAFAVTRTAAGYRFEGTGAGHGVGLCVLGSARMARAGSGWSSILATYFPGTAVGPAGRNAARIQVTLPAGEERQRDAIVDLVDRSIREWADRLALPIPGHVRLVFHPTVEAYSRAVGQPWWTAGATRGNRIELLPPSVLRSRGILDRTIRHELAHVMTAGTLAARPIWVREAAALYLCGESQAAAAAGSSASADCPSDAEMRHPASAEAMSAAYTRASACFARQLAAGRRWSDVR